jgi:hypothetical protein
MKICNKCGIEKNYSDFYIVKAYKDGYNTQCKSCLSIYNKKYTTDNKGKRKQTQANWRNNNKNYHNNWKIDNPNYYNEYRPNWVKENQDYYKEYTKVRCENDLLFKEAVKIRIKTRNALFAKFWIKNSTNYNLLKCSLSELKSHFELKFTDNMSWENYGEWEIDHITPLSSAKNLDELYKLCEFINLQPLLKRDNRKKLNKF